MKKILFSLFVLILFIPKTVFAIEIDGYVYDTNDKPLGGVYVSTKDDYEIYYDETRSLSSDFPGLYGIFGLRQQKYAIKYEKEGYQTQTKDIDLTNYNDSYMLLERVTMLASTTDGTIAGTWKGNYTIPDWNFSADLTAQLEQNGNDITGNTTTSDGCNGTITGTIEESILTFVVKVKKTANCCKGKLKGTAIITCSEDHMVLTFTIKDNCSGKSVGSGELWKQ